MCQLDIVCAVGAVLYFEDSRIITLWMETKVDDDTSLSGRMSGIHQKTLIRLREKHIRHGFRACAGEGGLLLIFGPF